VGRYTIYTHGVLKPQEELALPEAQRVRLVVEPLDDDTDRGERSAALQRLLAGIEGMKFFSRELVAVLATGASGGTASTDPHVRWRSAQH
jgi:predicted DNA-binding antitoxin AbrB/MazE fold protein